MGKSYGREEVSIAATRRSVSESKAFFFDAAFHSGHSAFDRGAGVPSLKPEKDSRSIGA